MEKELISVIVPVHNIEQYLPKCLECIERQTYRNLEIILVDDGSTDGSGKICDEYAARDSRARVIHQANKGLWATRNAGQDEAHGDYLWFPDGDDYFHYDFLRLMHAAITDGEGYDLAICGMKTTTHSHESCDHVFQGQWTVHTSVSLFPRVFTDAPWPNVWNKLYRTSSIHDLKARPYRFAQDLDFNIRVFIQIKTVVHTEEALYYWVQHGRQISRKANYFELFPGMFYRNYMELPQEREPYHHILLDQLYRKMVPYKARSAKTALQKSRFEECKRYYDDTISDYLKEKNIPNAVKAKYILTYRLPYLEHWFFKFLDKHPKLARRFRK